MKYLTCHSPTKASCVYLSKGLHNKYIIYLSPGQADSQLVASSRKLNLRRDLRRLAKRTRKFPRKYTQVAKNNSKVTYPVFHCLISCYENE